MDDKSSVPRGPAMADYRLYYIAFDDHIVMREDIEAADDAAAIAEAEKLSQGRPIEVWQRDRMVTKVVKIHGSLTPGDLFARFMKRQS